MSVGRVDEPFPNISLSVFKILIKPVHAQPDLIGLRVHEDEGGLENRCGERFVAGAHRLPKVVHNVLCRNGTLDDETLGMFKGGIRLDRAAHDRYEPVIESSTLCQGHFL